MCANHEGLSEHVGTWLSEDIGLPEHRVITDLNNPTRRGDVSISLLLAVSPLFLLAPSFHKQSRARTKCGKASTMSTPVGAVQTQNAQKGVKRSVQGNPVGVPMQLPGFRGRTVDPGAAVKAPKLRNGNLNNETSNVSGPLTRPPSSCLLCALSLPEHARRSGFRLSSAGPRCGP